MKPVALCFALLAPPALAETTYPSLHDVAGVAANDMLNLRSSPNAGADIVGRLPPDRTGVEVVGLSENGKWGRINLPETSGWASMAYLSPQDAAAWFSLQQGLSCFGTEPFWNLPIDTGSGSLRFLTPDAEGPEMEIAVTWPGAEWRPVAALQFIGEQGKGWAVIRAEDCSDGMSDRVYGLAADIFLQGNTAAPAAAMPGCCMLVP